MGLSSIVAIIVGGAMTIATVTGVGAVLNNDSHHDVKNPLSNVQLYGGR
ncbi:MAG: hypothetical protein ACJ735_04675 [Actinomycetes bacterium]